jgi:hypothetical protein
MLHATSMYQRRGSSASSRTKKFLLPFWLPCAVLASLLSGAMTGCGSAAKSDGAPQFAAKTELLAHETELLKITRSSIR